jgi:hypothetical protein
MTSSSRCWPLAPVFVCGNLCAVTLSGVFRVGGSGVGAEGVGLGRKEWGFAACQT